MQIVARRAVISDVVVFAELDQEAVLLNIDSGVYFGLDSIGTAIWQLLSRGASDDAIVTHLLAEYDVELDRLRDDVEDFIALLAEKGLVTRAPK